MFDFIVNVSLPDHQQNPEDHLDALYEAGCDDATVGVGNQGMISLHFTRQARTMQDALHSGMIAVLNAIPGSNLHSLTWFHAASSVR